MVVQLTVANHLNDEDATIPPAEAVEATIEAFLELTSDNLVVDQIFNEEGLCGPDDIRVVSGQIQPCESAASVCPRSARHE